MNAIKQSKLLQWSFWVLFTIVGLNNVSMVDAGILKLKFGHYVDDKSMLSQTAHKFKDILHEQTKGRIEIDVSTHRYPRDPREMIEQTRVNALDLTLAPAIYLRHIVPKFDILGLPFLLPSYEDVDRILGAQSNIGRQLLAELERGNLKGMAFWEGGFRHISTSRRQIKGPWDLEGLTIRTLSDQVLVQTFNILGAKPVLMSYSELFPSLAKGVLDGQESTIETFYRFKLSEIQKYLSLTRHSYTALVLVMSLKKFSMLSPVDQQNILNAAQKAADWGRNRGRTLEQERIGIFEKMGVKVERSPDWHGFRKRVFYEVQEKFVRKDGQDLLWQIERNLR